MEIASMFAYIFVKVKYYETDENILQKIKTITNKNNKNI